MADHQSDDLHQRSRIVVDRLMARYAWTLLEREEFVRRVALCVSSGEVDDITKAAFHVYCVRLYTACAGSEGLELQETGFMELHRYLYALSYKEISELPADVRDDIVSETLLRIWQNMAKYRKPGAFLAIVVYEMRNVVRPLWLRPMVLLSLDDYTNEASGQTVDDLLAATYTQELREQVKACFDEMLRRHPRAKQQLEAVWLKYIAGLDDETISILLQKPIANVQVLRTRGMNHLRDSSDWQELATELGL